MSILNFPPNLIFSDGIWPQPTGSKSSSCILDIGSVVSALLTFLLDFVCVLYDCRVLCDWPCRTWAACPYAWTCTPVTALNIDVSDMALPDVAGVCCFFDFYREWVPALYAWISKNYHSRLTSFYYNFVLGTCYRMWVLIPLFRNMPDCVFTSTDFLLVYWLLLFQSGSMWVITNFGVILVCLMDWFMTADCLAGAYWQLSWLLGPQVQCVSSHILLNLICIIIPVI